MLGEARRPGGYLRRDVRLVARRSDARRLVWGVVMKQPSKKQRFDPILERAVENDLRAEIDRQLAEQAEIARQKELWRPSYSPMARCIAAVLLVTIVISTAYLAGGTDALFSVLCVAGGMVGILFALFLVFVVVG